MSDAPRFLTPPKVQRVRYQRNFIKTAVCELRFPTLLELEEKPPIQFQQKLRKQYPFYESQIIESVGNDDANTREHRYVFRSKDQKWTISVKSFSIAIETSKYIDFEDFYERFVQILDSAKSMMDTDFFTRVGIRYINEIPIEDGNLNGWVRDDLISPIVGGVLGVVDKAGSAIQGQLENGQFTFRQNYQRADTEFKKDSPSAPKYILDTDYFKENVEFVEVNDLIRQFNEVNFSFFSWCLGEKSKAAMGNGKPK